MDPAAVLLLKLLLVVCLPGSNQGECGGPVGRYLPPRKLCCWNRWMRGKPERLLAAAKLARAEGISGACLLSAVDCTLFCRITPPADKITQTRKATRIGLLGWLWVTLQRHVHAVSPSLLSCWRLLCCCRANSGDSHCCWEDGRILLG